MPKEEAEKAGLNEPKSEKYLQGKTPKKIIVVPKRIINVVVYLRRRTCFNECSTLVYGGAGWNQGFLRAL